MMHDVILPDVILYDIILPIFSRIWYDVWDKSISSDYEIVNNNNVRYET